MINTGQTVIAPKTASELLADWLRVLYCPLKSMDNLVVLVISISTLERKLKRCNPVLALYPSEVLESKIPSSL